MKRLALLPLLFSLALPASAQSAATSAERRPNFLLITADDLNWDSLGAYGCKVPGITPHLDELAAQGMRFEHAHVNIAVCQPSRQSIMTGMYPHRNGGEGFEPINDEVRSLTQWLGSLGYLNGILGKEKHLRPEKKIPLGLPRGRGGARGRRWHRALGGKVSQPRGEVHGEVDCGGETVFSDGEPARSTPPLRGQCAGARRMGG
jgi:arylsulfatase A-like enzyme